MKRHLALPKLTALLCAVLLVFSVSVSASAAWTPAPDAKPSAEDLDAISADIVYPRKDSMYLKEYQSTKVLYTGVFSFKDPMTNHDPFREGNYTIMTAGTEVTVLAKAGGYSCVIYNESETAGWINSKYLECIPLQNP